MFYFKLYMIDGVKLDKTKNKEFNKFTRRKYHLKMCHDMALFFSIELKFKISYMSVG